MRDMSGQARDERHLDTRRMYYLLDETKAAVGYLYQLNPDRAGVERLYRYALEALAGISSELDGAPDRPRMQSRRSAATADG